jgi:ribosomal protein S27E
MSDSGERELGNIEVTCPECEVVFVSSLCADVMTCPACGAEIRLEEKEQ